MKKITFFTKEIYFTNTYVVAIFTPKFHRIVARAFTHDFFYFLFYGNKIKV